MTFRVSTPGRHFISKESQSGARPPRSINMSRTTTIADSLQSFHPAVQQWFAGSFASTHCGSRPSLAAHHRAEKYAAAGSHRFRQDAGRLPGRDQSHHVSRAADRREITPRNITRNITRKKPTPEKLTAVKTGVQVLYISPLKALGVDVQRNFRAPLTGIMAVAEREGYGFHTPTVGVRSGDTPATERHRMTRQPPEILITTPESLFLLLTSQRREMLYQVDTVIIDEIHSMAATKRGSHLFLSLERLEDLRRQHSTEQPPLQRIGLSATQRPLEEIARLLGGAVATDNASDRPQPRHVEIVQAGRHKPMQLTVEVPVEDMTRLNEATHESPMSHQTPKSNRAPPRPVPPCPPSGRRSIRGWSS